MSVAKVAGPVLAMASERYDPGISRSRCRNLFGPIDHEQMKNELRDELRRIVKEKEHRWNFDFVNQKPLVGDFVWQRIGDNRNVTFTTIASGTEDSTANGSCVSANLTTTSDDFTTDRTRQATNSNVNCMKTPERVTTKPHRRSPRITDYLRGRKKSTISRQIKFGRHAGDTIKVETKQARTSRIPCRGRLSRQSTLDELLPKLRPRHANGKTSS